jgi:hypothetical protein
MPALIQKIARPGLICAGLVAIHALLLAYAAAENSATFDEPSHLAAGVAYWWRGDFSIYCLSPPLLRLWAAAPAVLAGAQAPDTAPVLQVILAGRHWPYADMFVSANLQRFEVLLMLARWGMIPLSCLAAWITYRWASSLYGPLAGAAACALYCFNPSILAHGALVTTDVGTATAILAAAWLWWRWCRSPSWIRWAWVCVALVAAHLCKFTAVLLWPMMLVMAIPFVILQRGRNGRRVLAAWAGAGAVTLLLLNAVYGFRGTARAMGSFEFSSQFMQHVQQHLPSWFPSPVPQLLINGFDAQKTDTEGGYQGFLFGQTYTGSHWYYYPLALLCKMPVALWALVAAALLSLVVSVPGHSEGELAAEWAMFAGGIVYLLGVLLLGDLNIGTRYLLPAFPFAMMFVSRLWALGGGPIPAWLHVRNGILGLMALETLWACPNFLSFINFAAGGPGQGWQLLTDSDFDWGQGLISLRHWMRQHQVKTITPLIYFGYVDPAAYGIGYSNRIDPGGYAAFSTYYLNGLTNRFWIRPGQRAIGGLDFANALRSRTPVAVVADTLFIYTTRDMEAAMIQAKARGLAGP